MSIDPVAVYAAIVATGALGWQVRQWRLERTGRLDVAVAAYRRDDEASIWVTVTNSNDYAVKLHHVRVATVPG